MSASQHPRQGSGLRRAGWLSAGLIALGTLAVLGALALLGQTWAWAWRSRSGATYSLSQIHAACTSTLGELSQAVSGRSAANCTRIDGIWTVAVGLLVAGIIIGVIGLARVGMDMRRLWTSRGGGAHAAAPRQRAGSRRGLMPAKA